MEKKFIFVIDDESASVAYMELLLTCYGYIVKGFSSVEELFKSIDITLPDLIFVDLILRHTTGYEVLRRLRANPKSHAVPVILYTSSRIDSDTKSKGLSIGADDFLTKPFDQQELKAKLERIFQRREEETKEKEFIRDTLRGYISKDILKVLMEKRNTPILEGEKREVTVLFSDIREFTRYSEQLPPTEVVNMLNEYLKMMTAIIIKCDGVIDKFMGDAILSFWNAPFNQANHELKAARCALEMLSALQKYNIDREKNNKAVFSSIGIGINTGIVVAGLIGSEKKMEYTLIGNTVNIAARLQAIARNKIYISEITAQKLKNFCKLESIGKVKFKGKEEEIEVFELIGMLW
ncbi:MAG: adenylate/guanylate cyclase domain-containing response regulator [Elusimicrobiota bacterium]